MEVNDQTVFNWVGGVLSGLLGWLGIRLHGRVDELEREAARKRDMESMRSEIREDMRRIYERLEDIADRLPRRKDQ